MFTIKRSVWLAAVAVTAAGLASPGEVLAGHGGKQHKFQFAYVTRAATDRVNAEGTVEVISGEIESLQRRRPGRIIGHFEERILYTHPETNFAPEGYPEGSFIGKVVETVSTRYGDIYFEALIAAIPGAEGDLFTSALSGEITGGTGIYRNARGNVTMTGRVTICELGELGCAESDFAPAGMGLNYECHFILRGRR